MGKLLTVPARINLLGNPGDANEGDFAVLSAAVNIHAGAYITEGQQIVLEMLGSRDLKDVRSQIEIKTDALPTKIKDPLAILRGPINQLYAYSQEFREKCQKAGCRIRIWTDVPRQSGLGGSSLLIMLVLASLREHYELDPFAHNNYVLAELTQRTEANQLGITCGYADRYVPLFGGLAYVDYRGKLLQKQLDKEPYATYERLTDYAVDLPLVAIATGVERDSGDVHGRMRPLYLIEHEKWVHKGGQIPPMVEFMQQAWETAWKGKIAVLRGDLIGFGELMNLNHRIVNEMMVYCGFQDGAGSVNNGFIDAALANGALGAKLTGAGGGGSVFALAEPGKEQEMMAIWKRKAQKMGLKDAVVYQINIENTGLTVQPWG